MAIWQHVVKRKNRTVFDRIGPNDRPWQHGNNLEAVSKVSTSVYVTNFPSYLSSVDLKSLCDQFGVVIDVFISKKLSKVGKRFGFVRFIRVSDVHVLISNLCSIWVGSFKMFASKARFDRTANSPKPYSKIPAMSKPDIPEEKKRSRNLHFSNGGEPLSYASAVMGKTRRSEVRPSEEILNLTVGDFVVEKDEQKRFLLGRVNDFHILPCLDAMCKSEGFLQIEFRYVGGLWVLIEFISDIAAQNFKINKVVDSWFKELSQWNRDFVCSERLVWIDIEGVPLKAWNKGNFKKIINKWGSIAFMDDVLGDNLFTNRVCIETRFRGFISEELSVNVEGILFIVRLKEVVGWFPSFKDREPGGEESSVDSFENRFDANMVFENRSSIGEDIGEDNFSSDPFELRDLIHAEMKKTKHQEHSVPVVDGDCNSVKKMDAHKHVEPNVGVKFSYSGGDDFDDNSPGVDKNDGHGHGATQAPTSREHSIDVAISNRTLQGASVETTSHPPGYSDYCAGIRMLQKGKENHSVGSFSTINKVAINKEPSLYEGDLLIKEMGCAMGFDMDGMMAHEECRMGGDKVSP